MERNFLGGAVGHRLVAAGGVADVVDPSDSQLDGEALRGDRGDVLEPNSRIGEQHL